MVMFYGLKTNNIPHIVTGLVVDLPLWKMMEFVSWDDDIPNMMGKIIQMFQTTNQVRYI